MRTKNVRSNLLTGDLQHETIYICVEGDLFPICIRDILYCKSNNSIVTFIIKTENTELNNSGIRRHNVTTKVDAHKEFLEWETYMTMKELTTDLAELNFCRIHNKYLVNMAHVRRFMYKYEGMCRVKLSNGEILPVSASGKKEFLKIVGKK